MYSSKPSYVFGFHGLDKDVAMDILTQKKDFKCVINKREHVILPLLKKSRWK